MLKKSFFFAKKKYFNRCNKVKIQDVRVDPKLNKFLWSQGVRNVTRRVRVRLSRKKMKMNKADQVFTLYANILQQKTIKVYKQKSQN